MANVYLDDSILTGIANQTRRLTNTQDTYTPSEMVEALSTVETGITPTGTINITENGTVDVTNYASANVNTKWVVPEGVKFQSTTVIPSNIDTSHILDMTYMFYQATVTEISTINTSSATSLNYTFGYCTNLVSISNIDTSHATNMSYMFRNCTSLVNVPIMDFSSVRDTFLGSMFQTCSQLSDTSVDNILQSCTTVNSSYKTNSKQLKLLGFNATNYPASRIQALPHYQDFINAGWTIGY